MRIGRVITIVVIALAAAGAAYFAWREEPVEPIEVIAADVRRADVVQKVRAVGHIEPVTQVKVSSNVTGDLLTLKVKEGETVKRGTLLAEIDRERLLAIVRQNEANARSMAAAVELEQAQLHQAEQELRRTTELHAKNLATDAERERGQSEISIIKARLEAARQRVEQARASLDEAREQLKKATLYAPIDGTVIELNKKVGERIRGSDLAEDVLLTLAPLHAMQVEVEVSEQDVVQVQVGQAAEIEIDAVKRERPFPGRVVEIANNAVIKNRGTEMETTGFMVKVALEEIPENVRSGMSAAVAVVTEVKKDVLAVPIEAVTARLPSQLEVRAEEAVKRKKEGLDFSGGAGEATSLTARRERPVDLVFVIEGGKAEPRQVKTGVSSDTDLEILEGLGGKEELIIGPYQALAKDLLPGSPVKIARKQAPPARQEPAPVEARAPSEGTTATEVH